MCSVVSVGFGSKYAATLAVTLTVSGAANFTSLFFSPTPSPLTAKSNR